MAETTPPEPEAPKPGSPEFLAMLEHLKDVTEAETGVRPVAFFDVTDDDWRQELRKQLK